MCGLLQPGQYILHASDGQIVDSASGSEKGGPPRKEHTENEGFTKMTKTTRKMTRISAGMLLAAAFLPVSPAIAQHKAIVPAELAPAPSAASPLFSPGILADGTLYVAGELGTDLKTKQIPDDFDQEVRNSFGSIGLITKRSRNELFGRSLGHSLSSEHGFVPQRLGEVGQRLLNVIWVNAK
jgi:hypothetical protein